MEQCETDSYCITPDSLPCLNNRSQYNVRLTWETDSYCITPHSPPCLNNRSQYNVSLWSPLTSLCCVFYFIDQDFHVTLISYCTSLLYSPLSVIFYLQWLIKPKSFLLTKLDIDCAVSNRSLTMYLLWRHTNFTFTLQISKLSNVLKDSKLIARCVS